MSTADSALPFGVYETPITRRISERLTETQKLSPDSVAEIKSLDDEEVKRRYTDALAREFSLRFEAKLSSLNEEKERIALINSMAALLDTDSSVDSEQLLTSIRPTSLIQAPQLPEQPLSSLALLTNAKNESNMDLEIRRELETADSVDLLCAFIKTGGLRVLDEPLLKLRDRGVPLRIITTTYCGATDKEAIDRLVEKYGAEIKISYETNMTRLHAKAWLFNATRDLILHTSEVQICLLQRWLTAWSGMFVLRQVNPLRLFRNLLQHLIRIGPINTSFLMIHALMDRNSNTHFNEIVLLAVEAMSSLYQG